MTEECVGEVEAVSKPDPDKKNRWGVKVNGDWHNDFGNLPEWLDKGIVVKLKSKYQEEYGNYRIKSISPYDEKEKKKGTQSRKDTNESITKAVAWKVAMNCEKVGGFKEKKEYARKVYKDLKKDWSE